MGSILLLFCFDGAPSAGEQAQHEITKYKLIEVCTKPQLNFVYIFRHATSPSLSYVVRLWGGGGDRKEKKG